MKMGDRDLFTDFLNKYRNMERLRKNFTRFGLETSFNKLTEGLSTIIDSNNFQPYKNKLEDKVEVSIDPIKPTQINIKGKLKSQDKEILKELLVKFHYDEEFTIYDRKFNAYIDKNSIRNFSPQTFKNLVDSYKEYLLGLNNKKDNITEFVTIVFAKKYLKLSYAAIENKTSEDDNLDFEKLNESFNKYVSKFRSLMNYVKDIFETSSKKITKKEMISYLKS